MTPKKKLEALRQIYPQVSRETEFLLVELEAFFLKWASTINLVSPATLPHTWTRHVLDSAQLIPLADEINSWLDLGSGSGFPGLVLAAFAKSASGHVTMVESNHKKAAYLRQAAAKFDLPATVKVQRVEAYKSADDVSVITARAFAPLSEILRMTDGLYDPSRRALLHKGRGYAAEIEAARDRWTFDLVEHRSLIDPESVILDISGVRSKAK